MPSELLPFHADTYRIEDSVGYLLSRARAMLAKSLDAALLTLEITHAQAGILLMLASGRYTTAADLVREMYTDAASMTRMLDRLQKHGLVQRIPHPDDRRQIRLHLTAAGTALAAQLPPILAGVLNAQFEGFSAEEIGFLKSLLRKMIATGTPIEAARSSAGLA
jgi:DNA-binding MarR family transcriptional regulator